MVEKQRWGISRACCCWEQGREQMPRDRVIDANTGAMLEVTDRRRARFIGD
jgi:hypothetical protein